MNKKFGALFIAAGTALVLLALSFFCYNLYEDAKAGDAADSVLSELRSAMGKRNSPVPVIEGPSSEQPAEDQPSAEAMEDDQPVVYIDGYEYIGCLSIPTLELELPVMADWSYSKLKLAPCRQYGSAQNDDLVIAAHNYKRHFGRLNELKAGDGVSFTDMDGRIYNYKVVSVEILKPTDVEAVKNSGSALVLYTCTYGGKERSAVFCGREDMGGGN